jgi:hypothetical protein
VTKRMNWALAAKRERMRPARPADIELVPVDADESFWKRWRENPRLMRAAGYRVTKIGNRWHAYVQRVVT